MARTTLSCLLAVSVSACNAYIEGGASSGSEPGFAGPGRAPGNAAAGTGAGSGGSPAMSAGGFALTQGAGARPRLWRLTHAQYRNALRDLLNVELPVELPDDGGGGFGNRADLLDVSQALLELYAETAEKAAEQLIPARVDQLLTCQPLDAASPACAETFIRNFGARAWRRPLEPAEVTSLLALHADVTEQLDGNAGLSAALQAILTSPKFLFRFEVGEAVAGSKDRRLTPFEIAGALSFGYWNTTPDQALLDAAQAGKLTTSADIQGRVTSMLSDPRAKETATDFVERWLGIEDVANTPKSATLFALYSPELMASLASQARLFAGATLWDSSAGLRGLLTSPAAFVDQKTAAIYGVSAPASPLQQVMLDPSQRSGILTQAAFLAAHASEDATKPVLRGKFVRENLLCEEVPAPPPNVNVDVPETNTGQTARERFSLHASDPACGGCHRLFDGLGFAFESYDALGRFRTLDAGKPIDTSGKLLDAATGSEQPFRDAIELVSLLADSEQTYRCFTQRLFESFSGRQPSQSDLEDLTRAHAAFHDAGYDVKKLLATLAVTNGFSVRGGTP